MKKNKLVLVLLVNLLFINLQAQSSQISNEKEYKGYENSLRHGVLSNFIRKKIQPNDQNNTSLFNNLNNIEYDFHGKVGNAINIPRAVQNDSEGNIYITGSSGNLETKSGDITTIKVNASGEIVWSLQIPSPEFSVNSGTAITIDNNGFIYVVGYIWNQTSTDIVCIKMNTEGEILWQTTIGDEANFQIPTALTTSNSGEILIAGITPYQSKITYSISKLNADGSLAWQYLDNEFPSQTWNEPRLIKTDNQNNVMVCGTGFDNDPNVKIATIKLSNQGTVMWRELKSHQVQLNDELIDTESWPKDMIIDNENNIYIISNYADEFRTLSATSKRNTNGEEIWNTNHDVVDEYTVLEKVALNQNNLIVAGFHYGNNQDGFVLYNLSTNGIINWAQSTNEEGFSPTNFNMSIKQETIYLDAIFDNQDDFNSIIKSKTSSLTNGNIISSDEINLNNIELGYSLNSFFKTIINENSKTHTFANFYSYLGSVIEISNVDSNNNSVWNTKYAPQNSLRANVQETVTDSNNNVYSLLNNLYTTESELNTIKQKSYIVKYNNDGVFNASLLVDDSVGLTNIRLSIDNENNLILLKREEQSENITLKKISSNLTEIWSSNFVFNGIQSDKLAVDSQDNIYIINSVVSSVDPDNIEIALKKYNTNGTLLYSNNYQPENNEIITSFSSSILIDSNDNIFITGISTDGSTSDFDQVFNPFLLTINSDGTVNYFKNYTIQNTTTSNVQFKIINENIILTTDTRSLTNGQNGLFIIRLSNLGELINQNAYFSPNEDIYLEKMLHNGNSNDFFVVSFRLSEIAQNIQIVSWSLDGNNLATFNLESNNFYQDAFVDNQSIYVLSQNQSSSNFPFRLLNWIGPYITSKITKVSFDLNTTENFEFMGPNYTLFEPKQLIPMENENLLVTGKMFHEEFFFEGVKFFSIPYEPTLNIPSIPTLEKSKFYCYPNPSENNQTTIYFNLEDNASIKINLYDIHGRFIKECVNNNFTTGENEITFNVNNHKSGVYFLHLIQSDTKLVTKLIIK